MILEMFFIFSHGPVGLLKYPVFLISNPGKTFAKQNVIAKLSQNLSQTLSQLLWKNQFESKRKKSFTYSTADRML